MTDKSVGYFMILDFDALLSQDVRKCTPGNYFFFSCYLFFLILCKSKIKIRRQNEAFSKQNKLPVMAKKI